MNNFYIINEGYIVKTQTYNVYSFTIPNITIFNDNEIYLTYYGIK